MNRGARRRKMAAAQKKALRASHSHARARDRDGSRSGARATGSILEGWLELPVSLRLLRAFLGITFLYAGIQKLADPNFLHAGAPDYIGLQLKEFARGSPIGGLLHVLDQVPFLAGVGIALVEVAIGAGTLLGIASMLFAGGGFLVNLALTLSATWHVHPYFLGSDSIYAIGWLAYLLGLAEVDRRRRGPTPRRTPGRAVDAIGRREFLRGGALTGLTLFAGVAARALAGPSAVASTAAPAAGPSAPTAGGGAQTTAPPMRGTPIAKLDQIDVGHAIGFDAPGEGAAVLVRLAKDEVVAYSRVCTHAGCLVGYDPSKRLLYCPCHGAEFDPARGAAPIAGPAPTPLPPIPVEVDPATGRVVLPSA